MRMRFGHLGSARVLVVDDEPSIALSTAAILRAQGYEARTAFSGEDAVVEAASFAPDLVISDIFMFPNGIEAATHICTMFPECQVLFVSACAGLMEFAGSISEHLAYSFARKPMPVGDLLDRVATLLSAFEDPKKPLFDGLETGRPFGNAWLMALGKSSSAASMARSLPAISETREARGLKLEFLVNEKSPYSIH